MSQAVQPIARPAAALSPVELKLHRSIAEIGEERWDRLARPTGNPALRYAWLDALEQSGCVGPGTGWLPRLLAFEREGKTVAAAPLYVRADSSGEFVFDHQWAQVSERHFGVEYYPKLVSAVPFTPATGPRLLLAEGESRALMLASYADALRQAAREGGLSGVHVLFLPQADVAALVDAGYVERLSLQFHWRNQGFESFDGFLSGLKSKRRAQLRRERREVQRAGIAFEVLQGERLDPAAADLAFELYRTTVDQFVWGRQYLNRDFFRRVCRTMPEAIRLMVAYDEQRRPLAGTFNLVGAETLYGRYWGCFEERPFLHFETCYYQGIDLCIRERLTRFEPGAGGEHKLVRGFEPTLVHSCHWLRHEPLQRLIERFVVEERAAYRAHCDQAAERVGFRQA